MAALLVVYVWWIDKVRPGGDWDYKRSHGNEFENFGNFNYGATAQALQIPYYVGQSGAGVVNLASATITMVERLFRKFVQGDEKPLPEWWSNGIPLLKWPYGDDYKDAGQINAGYAFYHAKERGDCK